MVENPSTELLPKETSVDSGKTTYEIEGTKIEVAWKRFEPKTTSADFPLDPHRAVAFLPGWGYTESARPTVAVTQELANTSHLAAYSIDTHTLRGYQHSLKKEAEAVEQFLNENQVNTFTVVGQSQGGSQAIYLAAKAPGVDGLVLIDSMGLYGQALFRFVPRYILENYKSGLGTNYPDTVSKAGLKARNQQYVIDGLKEIRRQIRLSGGLHKYPQRLLEELGEMLQKNPETPNIGVPVVIVQGDKDLMVEAKNIIPDSENPGLHISSKDIHARERFLKENVFPKCPHVRMVVAEKMGYHGLPAFRPEQVAKGAIYLLNRWRRSQDRNSHKKT